MIEDEFNNLSYCSLPNLSPTLHRRRESVSIERFEAVKQFLASNGYEGESGDYYFFPGLLLEALIEVKAMERIQEKKERTKQFTRNEAKIAPMMKESQDLHSFLKLKIIQKSIDLKVEYNEQLKLYNLAEHLYFMYVGRFVKRENEFRLKKENPTELILEFISYQKEGKEFKERTKIQAIMQNRRKSRLRNIFTNPWDSKLAEDEESQIPGQE